MVEQESNGVREDFAQQPAGEVPQVSRPHPLDGVTSYKLAKHGVYPVAETAQQSTPPGSRITLFAGVWGQKLYAHVRQLFCCLGRVVVTVSYDDPGGGFDKFGDYRELVGVGWSHRDTGDHPRPADPYVHTEAVEGLPEEGILAEGRISLEAPTAVSAGEPARRQGHRVADGESGLVRDDGHDLLPEEFLEMTEVGALTSKKVVRWISRRAGNHCA